VDEALCVFDPFGAAMVTLQALSADICEKYAT